MVRPLRHAARSMMREDDAGRTCAGRRADASAQRHLLSFARQCCWRSWRAGGEDSLHRPSQVRPARVAGARRTPPPACRSPAGNRAAASPGSASRRSRSASTSGAARPCRARLGEGRRAEPVPCRPACSRRVVDARVAVLASRRRIAARRSPGSPRPDPARWSGTPSGPPPRAAGRSSAAGVQHGAHEILAGRRIDPGGAQHDRRAGTRQHRLLAGQLARAIHALRRRSGRSRHRARPSGRRTRSRSRRGSAGCRPPAHSRASSAGPSRLARNAASASSSAASTAV